MLLAIFFVPEVLWSPLSNFYYQFYQGTRQSNVFPLRDNFLQNNDNLFYLKATLLIQFVGVLIFNFLLWRNKENINNTFLKWLVISVSVLLLILTAFAAYFAYTFKMEIL